MPKHELRKKMANEIMEVELLPTITEISLKEVKYEKYPIENLSALGVATKPLIVAMESLKCAEGTSGIYRVNTKGHKMFESQGGFIGSLQTTKGAVGGGQAIMKPLVCDPTMIFMSIALMTIEKKLDDIKKIQNEMLDLVKAKEKANVRGNINVLIDVLNNYKFNCNNEKYKTNKHILVQDIKRNAEQNILLYRELIQSMLAKKELIHSDQEINSKIKKADENFKEYQLSLYLHSFSSFLEVMLLGNFDKNYIESIKSKIEENILKYKELYTKCYNEIESYTKNSVQSVLTKGIAQVTKGAGEVVSKMPLVSKVAVDEFLLESSEKINKFNNKRNDKSVQRLVKNAIKEVNPFVASLNKVSKIYNDPIEVLIDNKNIYLVEGKK